jgi:hypothetical protein
MCFPHVSKIQMLTYNLENNVIIECVMINTNCNSIYKAYGGHIGWQIRLEDWAHKTRLPRQFVLKCMCQPRKVRVMYFCVRGIDFAFFCDFYIYFVFVPTVWYALFFILYQNIVEIVKVNVRENRRIDEVIWFYGPNPSILVNWCFLGWHRHFNTNWRCNLVLWAQT